MRVVACSYWDFFVIDGCDEVHDFWEDGESVFFVNGDKAGAVLWGVDARNTVVVSRD